MSVPRVNFCFEVPNISRLESTWSPQVLVREVQWAMHVCKDTVEENQSLCVYLHCMKQDRSTSWSYVASSSIEVLSFNDNVEATKQHNQPCVFNDRNARGFGGLVIGWNDLFDVSKCYVKNDTITLDIKIEAANPNDPDRSVLKFEDIHQSCENVWFSKFRLTIAKIENLVAVKSPEFKMQNIPWYLIVYKHQGHLGVRLFLNGQNSCSRTMLVKLLSTKEEKSVSQVNTKCFKNKRNLTTKDFISWSELLKTENGFINNNSIIVEVLIAENAALEAAKEFHQKTAESESKLLKINCPICAESLENKDTASVPCGHLFCLICITKSLEDCEICPLCKAAAEVDDLRRTHLPLLVALK